MWLKPDVGLWGLLVRAESALGDAVNLLALMNRGEGERGLGSGPAAFHCISLWGELLSRVSSSSEEVVGAAHEKKRGGMAHVSSTGAWEGKVCEGGGERLLDTCLSVLVLSGRG